MDDTEAVMKGNDNRLDICREMPRVIFRVGCHRHMHHEFSGSTCLWSGAIPANLNSDLCRMQWSQNVELSVVIFTGTLYEKKSSEG